MRRPRHSAIEVVVPQEEEEEEEEEEEMSKLSHWPHVVDLLHVKESFIHE